MALKKGLAADERADETPATQVPATTGAATEPQASIAAADPSPTELPPIAAPIIAVGDDGEQRPMSGGSFVRLADGTLIRNQEA